MDFHYGKLFLPEFQPTPFCQLVRRSDKHSAEGSVSLLQGWENGDPYLLGEGTKSKNGPDGTVTGIKDQSSTDIAQPIRTICRLDCITKPDGKGREAPMSFRLSAAAEVR